MMGRSSDTTPAAAEMGPTRTGCYRAGAAGGMQSAIMFIIIFIVAM